MPVLTPAEVEAFRRDGWLLLRNAVTPAQLAALQADFAAWVAESRGHDKPYGQIMDGRPRFDLEAGHSPEHPALRRVNAPTDVSPIHHEVMANSRMTDAVAELIGPNVKFHHSKTNSKLPGTATKVRWHQDFPFTPHSNDDIVTALLFLDEVTLENGPLQVASGTHRGPIHGLWHGGRFTGAMDEASEAALMARAETCVGPAGAACLMHTRLAHGSAPNLSRLPRTLFICVYSAEDAVPLVPSPVPSRDEGQVVRGQRTGRARSIAFELTLPQKPATASFFNQQAPGGEQAGGEKAVSYDG